MLCIVNGPQIVIKTKIQDVSHVLVGISTIAFWVSGYATVRRVRQIEKPHVEFSVNELQDFLGELKTLQKLHGVVD